MDGICTVLAAALLAAAAFQLGDSQTPVPAKPLGFVYQTTSNPNVVIETFYDHLCDDSMRNWPVLKQVLAAYKDKGVAGILHIFPLPYHHNAYFVQQAGVVVRRQAPEKFVDFVELIFANQDMFLAGAVNKTEPEVQASIAQLVHAHLDISTASVMEGFSDATVTMDARYAWKYAASRGMTGTPQFLVNGVHVPDAPEYTAAEWGQFIDSLLTTPTTKW